jgi:hypothetical protein
MLYHINAFRKLVYDIPHDQEEMKSSTTLALQSVFKNLQDSPQEVSTRDLTIAFGWTSHEAFMQQDIQEMLRVLLDKLEEQLKGSNLDGMVQRLFAGKVQSYIRCVHVNFESKREEDFYDIQLDVKGCKNVYDSFRKYIEIEMLDGENQYDAGELYGKQNAKKGVIFTQFPPVLTIHLKRFDFDYNTMSFKKIHNHYEFPTILQLDEYLVKDGNQDDSNNQNQNHQNQEQNRYLLHSVLVHSGDAGGGHYYAYIRPYTDTNYHRVYNMNEVVGEGGGRGGGSEWFKFNDEIVLRVEEKEAVKYCYGRRPEDSYRSMSSAYMLVYIRQEDAPEIMRPILDSDIPYSLQQRLSEELKMKRQLELKQLRSRYYMKISYATEEDMKLFSKYSRTQDLLDDSKLRTILIFKDSLYLGVQLKIAEQLGVSPYRIRLWRLEIQTLNKTSFIRVGSEVTISEISDKCIDEKFFIQVLNEEEVEEIMMIDDDHNDEEEKQNVMEFLLTMDELIDREYKKQRECRQWMDQYPELNIYGEDEEHPTESLGIGMEIHFFVELVQSVDINLAKNAKESFHKLTVKYLLAYKEYDQIMQRNNEVLASNHHQQQHQLKDKRLLLSATTKGNQYPENDQDNDPLDQDENNNNGEEEEIDINEQMLLFFKVFDPCNLIPELLPPLPSSTSTSTSEQDIYNTTTNHNNNNNHNHNIAHEISGNRIGLPYRTFIIEKSQEITPMKYLGYCVLKKSMTYLVAQKSAFEVLQQVCPQFFQFFRLQQSPEHNNNNNNNNNNISIDLLVSLSPIRTEKIDILAEKENWSSLHHLAEVNLLSFIFDFIFSIQIY